MTIGPSTSNSELADLLSEICNNNEVLFQLPLPHQDALNEAEQRIRDLSDDEG